MILPPLLASPLQADDLWSWDVTIRYESPAEGLLLNDRERWTVRVGKANEIAAERKFLGSWVDADTFVPATDPASEKLKGRIEADGTLSVKGEWSDPAAAKALRRLLNPDKTLADRVAGWPVVRRATLREKDATVPGNVIKAALRIDVRLEKATLGGREIPKKDL